MGDYRRIVTGHNDTGQAIIVSDGPPPGIQGNLHEMWNTVGRPRNDIEGDPAATRPVQLEPDENGTVFRFFEIKPESELPSIEERVQAWEDRVAALDPEDQEKARALRPDISRHPAMHKTRTVDYIILLKGEVTMLVDDGEVHMKPLDVLIQRGTNHGWVNNGAETAVLMAVLIDAEPLAT